MQLLGLVRRHGRRDDGTGHATRTPESGLGAEENVRDVLQVQSRHIRFGSANERERAEGTHLVFTKQGQVQQDLNGLGVSSEDDELGDTTVKSLGRCRKKLG